MTTSKMYREVELGDLIRWAPAEGNTAMVVGKSIDPVEVFASNPNMSRHAYFLRVKFTQRSDSLEPGQPCHDTIGYPSAWALVPVPTPKIMAYRIDIHTQVYVDPTEWEKMTERADPGDKDTPPTTWREVELEAIAQSITDALHRDMTPTLQASAFSEYPSVSPVRQTNEQVITLRTEELF